MKNLFFISLVISVQFVLAQQEGKKIYNPEADAKADIAAAVAKAKAENKNVFLQLGGNWCGWCIAFNKLTTTNDTIATFIAENYEVVHVNFSKENKNEEVFASLGYPNRFGFPVFVILDNNGNRIHTQNSVYLENTDGTTGHDPKKVLEFLQGWTTTAIDPKTYTK